MSSSFDLLVTLEEKPVEHQSQWDYSGEHECLYKIARQSIQ